MTFRPGAIRGAGSTPGEIDYRLARRSLISEFKKGRLAQHEVCDAHPELRRAAQECSEATIDGLPDLRGRPCCACLVRVRTSAPGSRAVHHLEGRARASSPSDLASSPATSSKCALRAPGTTSPAPSCLNPGTLRPDRRRCAGEPPRPSEHVRERTRSARPSGPGQGRRQRVGFLWRWRRAFFLVGLLFVLGIAGRRLPVHPGAAAGQGSAAAADHVLLRGRRHQRLQRRQLPGPAAAAARTGSPSPTTRSRRCSSTPCSSAEDRDLLQARWRRPGGHGPGPVGRPAQQRRRSRAARRSPSST